MASADSRHDRLSATRSYVLLPHDGQIDAVPTRNVLGRAAGDLFDQTDVRVLSGPADLVMLDVAMELFNGADAQRGFANTADAFNKDIEPPALVFEGK